MTISKKLKIMLKSILSLQMGEVATDKGKLVWDGDAELVEGMEVFIVGDDNEPIAAADGDYTTEDGKTIKVVDGKVAEIVDPDAEVADEPAEEVAETEIQEETNEDVDIVDEPDAEEATPEDRIAALEGQVAGLVEGINQIINAVSALEERVNAVEGKLAKVEEPAADPVDETPEVNQTKTRLSYLRKD